MKGVVDESNGGVALELVLCFGRKQTEASISIIAKISAEQRNCTARLISHCIHFHVYGALLLLVHDLMPEIE